MKQRDVWNKLYAGNLTWKKETIDLPQVMKGKKVLELGMGNGKTLISILKQKPSQVYGIDFSGKAVEKSKGVFGDKVNLIVGDTKDLPFEDESFDVVVAYYILNNSIKKDRLKILDEAYRVLKKGGTCVFEDFSLGDFRNKGKNYGKDENTIIKKNRLICHFFNEKEAKELFGRFSKLKIKTSKFYPIRNKNLKREIINCVAMK